ncbi:zinc finger protein 883-like [Nymphalis io]|uniref:zinc finger protein 883-like n=1 Tax=Inachis io TaxID=171585 RepID=UPI0021682FBB|nr:zinc finger protein 883-like [Nymphalis io]
MSISFHHKLLTCANSCRICLDNNTTGGIDLTKDQNVLQWFEYCVGISINIQCPPKRLCFKCADNINNYVKFKQKCLESEEHWTSLCEDVQKPNVVKEEFIKSEDTENIFHEEKHFNVHFEYDNKKAKHDFSQRNCDSEKKNIVNTIIIDKSLVESDNNNDQRINVESYINDEKGNLEVNENAFTKKHQCEKCKKEYRNHKWLVTHMMNVCYKNDIKSINIEVDRNKATKLEDAKIKKKRMSLSTCGLCNTSLSSDITKHMDEHWSNNDLQCQLCNYFGRDFADMVTHSFQHSPKMKLFCHACKKKKASVPSLQFHFRSVHLQKAGGLCSVCNKTFKKFNTWRKHERLHNENSLFICDHCGRKFLYKNEIKSHLIYHTDVRLFVCETCGRGFRRMSGLKDHIKNLHTVIHPVKCHHCDKTYKSQTKLDLHLRNLAKDKPFICEVCSKTFVSQKVLKKHMFWHTGERPHTCAVCGSRYKAKGQLNLHMRSHTGFMPHKCVDCGKGFPTSTQLRRHRSVHTGVRAYKCVHCERSFHQKKTLLEHAKQHKSSQGAESEN